MGLDLNSPENNDKGGDVFWCCELLVCSSHDESNDTLQEHAPGEGLLRTVDIAQKGTGKGPGQVEGVSENRPGKALPQRGGVANDDGKPFGREDTERETGEIVGEPNQADDEL
jgi:hypothetical protein